MTPRYNRCVRFAFRVGLLIALITTVVFVARQSLVAGMGDAPDGARTVTWTFSASEFEWDEGAYVSPPRRTDFPFTAAGVFFTARVGALGSAEISGGYSLGVELRLKADGEEWSPWYVIGDFEPGIDGQLYGENLASWLEPREVQVRIGSVDFLQEVIHDLTVIAIDASAGPTAAEAAAAAKTRTMAQAVASVGELGVPKPTVISRAEWGANEDWMTWPPSYEPVDKAIVHHTVTSGGADPAAEVRAIYKYHALTRQWGDIGYNFLVDRYGNIYEGRYGGTDVIGAHASYWNSGSMGVSVLGCYDNGACGTPQYPSESALGSIADLVAWASSRRLLDPRELRDFNNGYSTVTNYVLAGHRDYGSTACPGGNLYAELPNLRQMAWERMPEYDVRFDWHDTPTSLYGGTSVAVHPTLHNYGRLVWSDDAGVRLGYRWILDGQVVAENADAARIIPGAVVNFGEITSLVAGLTAPSVSGTYTLRWDLYRDGVGWFADQPAPNGRGQPLEVTVQVDATLSLDVALDVPYTHAGGQMVVNLTVQGPQGLSFETRTQLPPQLTSIAGSGHTEVGTVTLGSGVVTWTGIFNAAPVHAAFDVLVSSEIAAPLALSSTTELIAPGFSTLVVESWSVINGHLAYFPLITR
jgi:hypothetical protein